jgi:hypothetical protein
VAQSTVKLIVDAQNAIVPLQRVNKQTQLLSTNTNKLKGRLDKSSRSLKDTGKSAKTAAAGFGTLTKSIAPLLKALAVIGTARFVLFQTAQLETQTKALEVLTGSAEKAQEIVREIKEFGAVTPFKSSELIEVTKRMKAFGFATEDVVDITKRIADIAGTAGADINSVSLAIGKVQAKNKFMQEENIMLLEKGINVTKDLEAITGLTGEALAKAMSKGEVGADKFVEAIVRATSEGGQFFEGASKQSDTLAGKFSTFVDNVETFAQNLGKLFEEPLKDILDMLNQVAGEFNKIFGLLTDANIGASNKAVGAAAFKSRFGMQADAVKDITKAVELLDPTFVKTEEDAAKLFAQLDRISKVMTLVKGPDSANVLEGRGLLDPLIEAGNQMDDIRDKVNAILNAQKNLTKETKKTTEKTKETVTPKNINLDILSDEQKANIKDFASGIVGVIKLENDRKEAFKKYIDKQKQSGELIQASIDGNTKEVQLQHDINNAVAIHGEQNRQKITDILTANKGLEDQAKKTKEVGTAAESLKEKFKQIGETVRTDLVNNLTDAITGAKSFGDAMKNVLNNLKRQIIQLALNRSISAIGKALMPKGGGGGFLSGLFGKRAAGGSVSAGGAYVVGERGPELLQMGSKGGNIIPNNKIGGGDSVTNVITVNVDANSSNVTGNNADANQLGNQIAVAIQSELIKQKRAGGLLA